MKTGDDPGFGIYVHWPFCASKCPYCDFNSHVRVGGVDNARFEAAYLRELSYFAQIHPRETVTSIFFGGGTPSLMQPRTVAAILDRIATLWPVSADIEITLEANPSSVEASRFQGYRAAGVNRVSLGVQALNDPDLKRLGRLHTVAEARCAIDIARNHFGRVSFDLIYARPDQTSQAWRQELLDALAMQAGHLSLYQLTIEPDTAFAALHQAGRLVVPGDDLAHELFMLTQDLTASQGLRAYEISNHALPGQESRHNLLYWRYGAYVGVGAGAHGRLIADGLRTAFSTFKRPETWLSAVETHGHGVEERETLGLSAQADEMLLMGMRIAEGVDLPRLARLTQCAPSHESIRHLRGIGLVELSPDGQRLKTTASGRLVLNSIVLALSENLVACPTAAAFAR